jgi:hypothetical protein
MAKKMETRARTKARRPSRASAGKAIEEGAACPGELNLPQSSREDYVGAVLEQLGEFEERLVELESDLESAGWDVVGDYRGQLDDLRLRLRAARAKSEELEGVPDAEWPSLYREMEDTLLELAESVDDLAVAAGGVLPE